MTIARKGIFIHDTHIAKMSEIPVRHRHYLCYKLDNIFLNKFESTRFLIYFDYAVQYCQVEHSS